MTKGNFPVLELRMETERQLIILEQAAKEADTHLGVGGGQAALITCGDKESP